jgi:hypothetical protein
LTSPPPKTYCYGPANSYITVTGYNNVDKCNADSNTVYRIFDGDDRNVCHDFAPKNGVYSATCTQFNKGGWEKVDCNGDALYPESVWLPSGNEIYCAAYEDAGCQGLHDDNLGFTDKVCRNGKDIGAQTFKSWRCGDR